MNIKKIKEHNKKIQKIAKSYNKTHDDEIFIRHWNVFLNQARGFDIKRIEQKSRTPLYPQYVKSLAALYECELEEIKTEYSVKGDWQFLLNYSNLAKISLEVINE